MIVKYQVCSESFSIDTSTNKLSVFHIIDNISVASVPFLFSQLCICYVLEKQDEDQDRTNANIVLKINQMVLANLQIVIDFRGTKFCRNITSLNGVIVPSFGILVVELHIRGNLLHHQTIEIANAATVAGGVASSPSTAATQAH